MEHGEHRKKSRYFLKKCLSLAIAFCILFSGIFSVNAIAAASDTREEEKTEQKQQEKEPEQQDPQEGEKEQEKQKEAAGNGTINLTAPSAVLMEGSTGTILYEKDKDKERMIASVTKL